MSVEMVIKLPGSRAADSVMRAVETYKARLRASIQRTQSQLDQYERTFGVTTAYFLANMTAEDLSDDDIAYIEWAGEAELLEGLQAELRELDDAAFELP